MSLVTLGDKAKVLQMVESNMLSRDRMLLSLAGRTTWTGAQRELIEKMWNEWQQRNKEAAMKKKKTVLCVGLAMTVALMAGCAATYEKRFLDHDGKPVVITEHHDADWWNTLGTPDWMNVRHETITRDGQVVTDRHCRHEPTTPTLLNCENARE